MTLMSEFVDAPLMSRAGGVAFMIIVAALFISLAPAATAECYAWYSACTYESKDPLQQCEGGLAGSTTLVVTALHVRGARGCYGPNESVQYIDLVWPTPVRGLGIIAGWGDDHNASSVSVELDYGADTVMFGWGGGRQGCYLFLWTTILPSTELRELPSPVGLHPPGTPPVPSGYILP